MPILDASALTRDQLYRLLVLGSPKSGKTSTVVGTAPGPVLVMLCEDDSALYGVREFYPRAKFSFMRITGGFDSMGRAIVEAKKAITDTGIKTIVIDPFSNWAARLEDERLDETDTGNGPDGRRAYPKFLRNMRHLVEQLFRLPVHVIAVSHHYEKDSGQKVPMIAGKAGEWVAGAFHDIVWFDVDKNNKRTLTLKPSGAAGPGCRHHTDAAVIPADISALFKLFSQGKQTAPTNGASRMNRADAQTRDGVDGRTTTSARR